MSCPVNFTHTVQFLFFLLIYELPCELYPYGAVALLTLLILTLRCCVGTAALLSRRAEETQGARHPSSQQRLELWQWRWKRARGRVIRFILLRLLRLARRPGFRLSCQDLRRGERGRWWFWGWGGGGGNGFSTDTVDGLEEAYASVS